MRFNLKRNSQTKVIQSVIKPYFAKTMVLVGGFLNQQLDEPADEFAALVSKDDYDKCFENNTLDFKLCLRYCVLMSLNGLIMVDSFNIIGLRKNILASGPVPTCTCGSWSVRSNSHSHYCDIVSSFLPEIGPEKPR